MSDIESGVDFAFLIDGLLYASVAGGSLVQLVRNMCRYKPWTVQKMIHLLMFFATSIRSIFLVLVGLNWCGVLSGEIDTTGCTPFQRDLFYILDQFPILCFFAIYSLLMQFWAEVYYNAVDKILIMNNVIKPTIRVFIGVVVFLQFLFWIFYASVWKKERAFFTKSQAILNLLMFLLVTSGFIYFGHKAYHELRNVPVEIGIRSKKLKELASMTTVCTSCFIIRSFIQVVLSSEEKQLHDQSTWLIVIIYYALLEILPSIAILFFNRRLPMRRKKGLTTVKTSGEGHNIHKVEDPRGGRQDGSSRLFFFTPTSTSSSGEPDASLRKSLLLHSSK